MTQPLRRYWMLLLLTPALAQAQLLARASQPSQPVDDRPGGSLTAYAQVQETFYAGTSKALDYWLYEPKGAHTALPVVIFLHGYGADDPRSYRAWINHLAQRGRIVLFPRYQNGALTKTADFQANALSAVRAGLQGLQNLGSPAGNTPDLSRVAVVGHSIGGVLAVNFGAQWMSEGLPAIGSQPLAVFSVEPGKTWGRGNGKVPLGDLSRIPASTLLLTLSGDDDTVAGWCDAKAFWHRASAVPPTNKNYVIVHTDDYGRPAVQASHDAPTALVSALDPSQPSRLNGADAFDWYAVWKLFDGLSGAVFENQYRDYALGGGAAQTFMGHWNDDPAHPVTPIAVPDITGEPPATGYPGSGATGIEPYPGCH